MILERTFCWFLSFKVFVLDWKISDFLRMSSILKYPEGCRFQGSGDFHFFLKSSYPLSDNYGNSLSIELSSLLARLELGFCKQKRFPQELSTKDVPQKPPPLVVPNRFRTSVKIRVSGFLMDFFGPTKTEILPNPRPLTLQCCDHPDANGLFGFRVSTDKTTDPPRDEGSNGGGNGPVVVVPRWPPGWPR